MSVRPDFFPATGALSGSEGELVSVHVCVPPRHLEQLLEALETVATNREIRAVVLQANGRSFSTGGDLLGFYEHLAELEAYAGQIVGLLNELILAMLDLELPDTTGLEVLEALGRLARSIPTIIENGGFRITSLDSMYIPGWRPASFNYWGAAVAR